MANRHYYLIIDTETTQDGKVADFGALVCDRKGRIYHETGILVRGIYDDKENHPLFYHGDADPLWGRSTLPKRYARYDSMIDNGQRLLASVPAINRWLGKVIGKYNPTLTAYNLAFDLDKLNNTGIDVSGCSARFCLWHAAAHKWARTKAYRKFILETGEFNNRTALGNWSYRTKAETMARYLLGADLPDEPHTALEDARDYEMPILQALAQRVPRNKMINPPPFTWRDVQVTDAFKPV